MDKKYVVIAMFVILGLIVIMLWQQIRFNDGRLHVVFCDVGQGDAIFIRTPGGIDILFDGGPDRKVLDCVSRHMPFWDRTIELMILSHPHQDHFAGLIEVVRTYKVLSFVTEKLLNDTVAFATLTKLLEEKKLSVSYLSSGNTIKTADGLTLEVLAPSKSFLETTSPTGFISESKEFGSLVLLLSYGSFRALLTSDSNLTGLVEEERLVLPAASVLAVPHHGSAMRLTKDIVETISPKLAVISVGKNNRFGHPTDEVLKILRDKDIRILRTDQDGEIEIVSDGKIWTHEFSRK